MALSVVFYITSHQLNKMTRTSNGLTATSSYIKGLVVRGVCFHPSPSTLEHFNRAAQSKSPVKITNFDTGKKRKDDQVNIIIRKKTKLEETEETLPFQCTDIMPTTKNTTIGSLKDLKAGQLLTLTAMATNLSAIKEVTKRPTNEKLHV